MASGPDTTRTKVETYLPAYQKERWKNHAEELGMSQSEFVRTMVQAGRRGFGADEARDTGERNDSSRNPAEPRSRDATPRGNDLECRILDALEDGPCSWEELVERMTDDLEERLDATLERLQQENRVRYSGRNGGYTRTGGD